ncbi:hypothetical protein HDV02_006042, partial [Globomyces sp. JEL0801]
MDLMTITHNPGIVHHPVYHFTSPKNWMNDPCGPFFYRETQTYHLYYQYNPYGSTWGNMTWYDFFPVYFRGHATSSDLLQWQDQPISIYPSKAHNQSHVFSGMVVANGLNNLPTVFFTGTTNDPINWKIPYTKGSEKQMMGVSHDGGFTWDEINVVLESPGNYDVTGWRDPFVFQSEHMKSAFQNASLDDSVWFMIVSSGERNVGGRILLYHSNNMKDWKPLDKPFFEEKIGVQYSKYSPKFGGNLEMASYMELSELDNTGIEPFLFAGIESDTTFHDGKTLIWQSGSISGEVGSITFLTTMCGALDYGILYAANPFFDPKTNRTILWGWVLENDNKPVHQEFGYSGIVNKDKKYDAKGNWIVSERKEIEGNEIVTLKTLGIKPIPEISTMGTKSIVLKSICNNQTKLKFQGLNSKTLMIRAHVQFKSNERLSLFVRGSTDGQEITVIEYDVLTSTLSVIRQQSSLDKRF